MRDQLTTALARAQEKLSSKTPEYQALETLKNELGLAPLPAPETPTAPQGRSVPSTSRVIPAAAGPLWMWVDKAKIGDQYVIVGKNGGTRAVAAAKNAGKRVVTKTSLLVTLDAENPEVQTVTLVTMVPDEPTSDAGASGRSKPE